MYKLDEETYKQYFTYGCDNREELLEGLIFFTYEKDIFRKKISATYKKTENVSKEEIAENEEKELVKKAGAIYKQFYRFVELNDRPNIYNYEFEETKQEEFEEKVKGVINRLTTTKENYTEAEISVRKRTNLLFLMEKKQEIMKLNKTSKGLVYSDKQRARFAKILEGLYSNKAINHWTEQVYDILKFLEEAEKKDKIGYQDIWLRTRLQRAKNGTIAGIDENEIKKLEIACQKLREIRSKIKQEKNKQDER